MVKNRVLSIRIEETLLQDFKKAIKKYNALNRKKTNDKYQRDQGIKMADVYDAGIRDFIQHVESLGGKKP